MLRWMKSPMKLRNVHSKLETMDGIRSAIYVGPWEPRPHENFQGGARSPHYSTAHTAEGGLMGPITPSERTDRACCGCDGFCWALLLQQQTSGRPDRAHHIHSRPGWAFLWARRTPSGLLLPCDIMCEAHVKSNTCSGHPQCWVEPGAPIWHSNCWLFYQLHSFYSNQFNMVYRCWKPPPPDYFPAHIFPDGWIFNCMDKLS